MDVLSNSVFRLLPPEILYYLSEKFMNNLSEFMGFYQTCHQFHQLLENEYLWECTIKRYYGIDQLPLRTLKSKCGTVKKAFWCLLVYLPLKGMDKVATAKECPRNEVIQAFFKAKRICLREEIPKSITKLYSKEEQEQPSCLTYPAKITNRRIEQILMDDLLVDIAVTLARDILKEYLLDIPFQDIDLVAMQSSRSLLQSIRALVQVNGNIIDAIMNLTWEPPRRFR